MELWLKRIVQFLFRFWLRKYKAKALSQAKETGIKAYLRMLQGLRLSGLGFIALAIVLQLTAFGLALMIGALVFLSPLDLEMKLWLVFGFGSLLFLLPVLAILVLFSERLWYRASGAEKLVNSVLET